MVTNLEDIFSKMIIIPTKILLVLNAFTLSCKNESKFTMEDGVVDDDDSNADVDAVFFFVICIVERYCFYGFHLFIHSVIENLHEGSQTLHLESSNSTSGKMCSVISGLISTCLISKCPLRQCWALKSSFLIIVVFPSIM